MNRPTWLIGGGYDKKSTYDEWIEAFDGKLKRLILMGVTAPKIAECAKAHGFDKIKFVDSMEDAVSYIAGKAQMEMLFYYHLHVQAGECSRTMKSGRYLQRLCQKIKGELEKCQIASKKNIWQARHILIIQRCFL